MKIGISSCLIVAMFTLGNRLIAQNVEPHSLAIGGQNGVATVSRFELNASTIAIDLNHQRNVSQVFSWRTGLQLGYVFPIEYQVLDSTNNGSINLSQRINRQYVQVNLSTMPVFYYREKGFALFIGVGGGLGGQFEFNTFTPTDLNGKMINGSAQKTNAAALMIGWKPAIGASFNLGSNQKENEIEIMLSREGWIMPLQSFNGEAFYWYGLTLLYRHNFRKG